MKLGVMGSAVVQFNGAVFLFKLMINVSYEFCYCLFSVRWDN